jgi:methylated-DNA-protein-cysteine methyltransferase-like protein
MATREECYALIYALVRDIPAGHVMTYGQLAKSIATCCPSPVPAITVGRAMAASERQAPDLPWWRVIGQSGPYGVLRTAGHGEQVQRDLLAREGIHPDTEGRYELARWQYIPSPH